MNYKLTIQYDGTDFFGWQSQPGGNTIQDCITQNIETITRKKIQLAGSGRTDSGVHAFGQIANFRIDDDLNIRKFHHALNSILPKTIAITNIIKVDESFHSRFDASGRTYLYFIAKNKSPFYHKYSYYFSSVDKLAIVDLNKLSLCLIGEQDFTSFSRKNTQTENNICNIQGIHWKEKNGFIIFRIEANRFLHGMVRAVIGSILKAQKENNPEEILKEIISKRDRAFAGESVPAKGLFLFKVRY